MKASKKQYTYYSDVERMSYIREYLSSGESKNQFSKRNGFCPKLLAYWLKKYHIKDKDMGGSHPPVTTEAVEQVGKRIEDAVYAYNHVRPHQGINMRTPMEAVRQTAG